MPLRYFKCHTLPYPSYNVSAVPGTATDRLAISWTNGPDGHAAPTTTEFEFVFLFDTNTTNTASASGNLTAYTAALGGGSGSQVRVRLRRVNSAGAGEWTAPVVGTVA